MAFLYGLITASLIFCVIVTILLAWDALTERKAWRAAVDALQQNIQGQERRIDALSAEVACQRAPVGLSPPYPPAPDQVEQARRVAAPAIKNEAPPPSEPRPLRLEDLAGLSAEELARVDAVAAELNLTRKQALEAMMKRGIMLALARDRAGRESGGQPSWNGAATPETGHCHGPACGSGDAECRCTCPRCRSRDAS